ncbi:MAG: hypothetical protein IJY01_07000 [Clostridia bacterium]|nr:hypothetical protein [Clostridia bacterium]
MKRRIIALILVVVMLVATLVSCGYSYSKDDMAQYGSFDKTAFEAALKELVIEDAEFTTDADTRAQKVLDHIQELLVAKVDTDAKIREGVVAGNDKLYYCYYVTANIDGKDVTLFTTNMKESSAASVQLGLTDTEGFAKLVENAFTGVDLKDIAYTTVTSGTAATGKLASISYTVEYTETVEGVEKVQKLTYDNELVTLGDANHPVALKLVGSTIASSQDFEEGGKKYTSAKVNYTVETGKETVIKDVTYTDSKKVKDAAGTEYELKGVELSYHVYPAYFLEVEELSATTVIKTLLSALSTETTDEDGKDKTEYALPSIEANAELAKAVDELRAALKTATTEYDEALKAKETAEENLKKAEGNVKGETPTEAEQQSIDAAKDALNGNADKNIKGAIPTLNEKEEAKNKAEADLDAKIAELVTAIGEDKVVTEYKDDVYETLLDEYNHAIKMSLAKQVWKKMQEYATATVDNLPKAAIQSAYDRMIEQYEYTFYEGSYTSESDSSESNYKHYNGEFRTFLADKMGADSYTDAKHEVWADAKDYVLPIVVVYTVAAEFDLTVTKDDIKAAKDDTTKNYSYYEFYNGEENVEVAIQFDKLMNSILEYEENEQTGAYDYKKVTYTIAD